MKENTMSNAMPKRHEIDVQLTWNTNLIFPDNQAYKDALATYKKQVENFEASYKGKLTTLETTVAALKEYEGLAILESKLSHYAFLPLEVDKMNTELASLSNDFDLTIAYTIPKLSFLHTELSLLDQDVLESVITDQPQWKSYIQNIIRQKPYQLHPLQEELLANFAPTFGQPYNNYGVTKFEDMTFDSFEANGETLRNSYVLFENDYELSHDTEIRRNSAAGFYSTLKKYKNTTAAT